MSKYCSFKKNLGLFCPNKCWYNVIMQNANKLKLFLKNKCNNSSLIICLAAIILPEIILLQKISS